MEPTLGCNMLSEKVFSTCDGCAYAKSCGKAFKMKIASVGRHIIDHKSDKVIIRLNGEVGIVSKYDFDTTFEILKSSISKSTYELLDLLRDADA